jgi:hypothetical protein
MVDGFMIGRFFHRPAHSLARRTMDGLRSRFVGGIGKSQSVYFVHLAGHRYKRVIFADTRLAEVVESNLESVGYEAGLPRLVLRHENEIWVEFITGRPVDVTQAEDVQAIAELFAALYRHDAVQLPIAGTRLPSRLRTDLQFLGDAGVLAPQRVGQLLTIAHGLEPEVIWSGYDYVDPVTKNFIVAPRGLVAIDVESLQAGQPLGTGVAKCRVHWLGQGSEDFIARIIAAGAPDFRPQFRYVELCFLAAWTKRKLIAGKRRHVDPERFSCF